MSGLMLAFATATARAGCNGEITPLHVLAGSSRAHERVEVRGVVTSVFPGMRGFFLETPRVGWDADPSTPEAVFVYGGRHALPVERGWLIAFDARYHLFHGVPELSHVRTLTHCGHHDLPVAVDLQLPLVPGAWKAHLGMRVRMAQALTVGDLDDFVRYGEVRVSAGGRHYAPTALTVPGPGAASLARAASARMLWLDDGSYRAHPQSLSLGGQAFDARHPLRAGQRLQGVSGIAWHAFGRDLLEVTALEHTAGIHPRRTVDDLNLPPGLRLVSFNVENFFNRARSGPVFPTERGAHTASQFRCQTQKLVSALSVLRPAVAGLQEIENNGYGSGGALATLTGALDRHGGSADYRFVRLPHRTQLGTDLIAPALVYDARRVSPVGRVAVLAAPAGSRALEAGLRRPALAASFRGADGRVFTTVVVHLRSKRSTCGTALDGHDGAGHCAAARDRAARYVARWARGRPTGVKTGAVLLLGDFNAYPHEAAMADLRRAGWVTEPALTPARPGYTESGRWGAGRLDYILLAPGVASRVRAAAIWHSDADEAPGFGYAGRPACTGPAAPYRASDHDPVIVVLGAR